MHTKRECRNILLVCMNLLGCKHLLALLPLLRFATFMLGTFCVLDFVTINFVSEHVVRSDSDPRTN